MCLYVEEVANKTYIGVPLNGVSCDKNNVYTQNEYSLIDKRR